jgi:HEXXH motif-containing protein
MKEGVAGLLWRDTSLFAGRAVKAASSVAALRRTLDRRRPLAGRETSFFALHDDFERLPESTRAELQREPHYYFWARVAFELLGSVLGTWPTPALARTHYSALGLADPEQALAVHLDGYKRFVLAGCLLQKRDLTLTEPLEVALPFALPGTRLCLSGAGTVALAGVRRGELELVKTPSNVEIGECPLLEVDDRPVRLQPHVYNLAGLEYFRPAAAAGLDYQRQHRSEAEAALALVRRHQPLSLEHFRRTIRVLALKPPMRGSKRDNVSHSDLPGSILMSIVPRPHHLADVCIHETHHNRLFAIEDHEPLLEDADMPLDTAPRFYSPWQDDGRPLHGILHGVYVIIPTTRFWLAVLADAETDDEIRALAAHRTAGSFLQLRIAAHQVQRHGRLTPFGRLVLEELRAQVLALGEDIGAVGVSAAAPAVHCDIDGSLRPIRLSRGGAAASIRDVVQHHLELSELRDQVDDIRAHVAL